MLPDSSKPVSDKTRTVHCDSQTDTNNENDLQAIIKVLYADYQTEPYVSNWYDIKSTKIVIHPNTLTCSLYHKIFG